MIDSNNGGKEAPIHTPLEMIFVVVLTGVCASIFLCYLAYLAYDTFYGTNQDDKSKTDEEANPNNKTVVKTTSYTSNRGDKYLEKNPSTKVDTNTKTGGS